MNSSKNLPSHPAAPDSLIAYPCRFPIKVMGAHAESFLPEMIALAQRFDPEFAPERVEIRASSGGKYLGLTLNIWATSRTQLDDMYRALSSHPLVKVTL
jgi:putative lipoic acid-binding regulatory protein